MVATFRSDTAERLLCDGYARCVHCDRMRTIGAVPCCAECASELAEWFALNEVREELGSVQEERERETARADAAEEELRPLTDRMLDAEQRESNTRTALAREMDDLRAEVTAAQAIAADYEARFHALNDACLRLPTLGSVEPRAPRKGKSKREVK